MDGPAPLASAATAAAAGTAGGPQAAEGRVALKSDGPELKKIHPQTVGRKKTARNVGTDVGIDT